MSKQERVVCAAVRFEREHERTSVENNVNVLCVNYEDDVITDSRDEFERSLYFVVNREIQGFITNKNRFVGAKEAMKIAIKSGQYPDYELMKRKALEEIGYAKENEKHNESVGILGFRLYVADIPKLVARVKELDKLLERNYLLPEDLY